MPSKNVWIVFTKSSPLESCSIDIDGCDFYFAEVYVPLEEAASRSLDSVITRAKAALLDERLELVDVSKCIRYKEQEWSFDTPMNVEVHKLAKRALASGVVEFGGFRSEEIEELCEYHFSMNELDA